MMTSPAAAMKVPDNKRRRWTIVVALLACVISAVLLWHYSLRALATPYRTIPSPDGKYKIVVYSLPQFGMAFPGQGGDAPG